MSETARPLCFTLPIEDIDGNEVTHIRAEIWRVCDKRHVKSVEFFSIMGNAQIPLDEADFTASISAFRIWRSEES